MNYKRKTPVKVLLLFTLLIFVAPLWAQQPDTSSLGYKIGYHIGSWLPFGIIVLLMLLILLKTSRRSSRKN